MPIPYLTPFTSYPQFHTYYSYFSTIASSTMGAEIGIFSLNQIQKLAQSQQNHQSSNTNNSTTAEATEAPSWMWNPKNQSTHHQEQEDDSWEVRAFAEDTGNIMGTTWPPRSYTCTFCRREFRSAQALGGHMNVHRRDRARLHQSHPPNTASSPPQLPNPNNPTFIIPAQELIAASPHLNGQPAGLCLLYQLPNNPTTTINYNNNARRGNDHHHSTSPSTLLSFSPFTQTSIMNNLMPTQSLNFPLGRRMLNSANSPVINLENVKNCTTVKEVGNIIEGEEEEVDLELRLGHRSTMTSSSSSSN